MHDIIKHQWSVWILAAGYFGATFDVWHSPGSKRGSMPNHTYVIFVYSSMKSVEPYARRDVQVACRRHFVWAFRLFLFLPWVLKLQCKRTASSNCPFASCTGESGELCVHSCDATPVQWFFANKLGYCHSDENCREITRAREGKPKRACLLVLSGRMQTYEHFLIDEDKGCDFSSVPEQGLDRTGGPEAIAFEWHSQTLAIRMGTFVLFMSAYLCFVCVNCSCRPCFPALLRRQKIW